MNTSSTAITANYAVTETFWPRIQIVVAHPDDETIGLGGQLAHFREACIVHVTDGAPRRIANHLEYARTRENELVAALEAAAMDSCRSLRLGVPDQEASVAMADLARRLEEHFLEEIPDVVFTHPYEGGHPDHDATAFAVHAACALLARQGLTAPAIAEFTSYHGGSDGMVCGGFLPSENDVTTVRLSDDARARKHAMICCFASQQDMLRQFSVETESIRIAPRYRFTSPPHEGRLFYENFDWGTSGENWRGMARRAIEGLGIEEPL